jgi:uncharacterized LabA/DUF88 family protein
VNKKKNYAFIDGQNLYLGVRQDGWSIDFRKFRTYLRDKYDVDKAYYFLGYISPEMIKINRKLKEAGFILSFREHSRLLKSNKKGNVDCDIVFSIMEKIADGEEFGQVVLVSGDGDYIKLVDYLLRKDKFKKVLFPNKKYSSSLYNKYGSEYFDYLSSPSIKSRVKYKCLPQKRKGLLRH